jgi:hypothetical protein
LIAVSPRAPFRKDLRGEEEEDEKGNDPQEKKRTEEGAQHTLLPMMQSIKKGALR